MRNTVSTYNKIANEYWLKRDEIAPLPEIDRFESLINGTKILDAGCGPGRDSRIFAKSGYDVYGIDLSDSFLKIAITNSPEAKFISMNILKLEFENDFFDGIWCCAVLSHFKREDMLKALSEYYRVLKPGGILFIAVKEGSCEGIVLEEEFHSYPRFISRFSEQEIRSYLEESKFHLIDIYRYNEKQRFGKKHRDIDFLFSFSQKIQ